MSFSGKVVLVTGASSGIGAATATLFAKEGARVAIVGRNDTKLRNVAANIQKHEKNPLVIQADVSNDEDAKRIIQETVDKFGKLDVLVNNAGMARFGSLMSGDVMEDFDQLVGTNLRAVIHLSRLAVPHLEKTKGNIVNVSSVASQVPYSKMLAYSTLKAGLDHFSFCSASELAKVGVRVNVISPGPVRTEIIDNSGPEDVWKRFIETTALNRSSEPGEIADLILFVASEKGKGITGSNFLSDNGVACHVN